MVSDITRESCYDYADWRGRAPGTIRRELGGVLRAAINHAVYESRLAWAPKVFLPPAPPERTAALSRKQYASLRVAAQHEEPRKGRPRRRRKTVPVWEYLPLFLDIAVYTGQRKSAILDLRWPQIDFERELIDFNGPKRIQTCKRRPIVPIGPKLLATLRAAYKRRRHGDLAYVVTRDGRRLGDIKRSFRAACDRAGLGDDVVVHTLRHTSATWMVQAGRPLAEVARVLGHSEARTTEKYAHLAPDFLRAAVEALDG